jgi:hypothetical protein
VSRRDAAQCCAEAAQRNIQQEILATERSYVKGLQQVSGRERPIYADSEKKQLKRDFVYPLSKLLSEVSMANVFPAVNEIWKLHEHFLAKLEDTMRVDGGSRHIAGIFSELASGCQQVYSPFLNQFQQASLVLKRLMENDPKVCLAVEAIASPKPGGPTGLKYLNELMITPMQRLVSTSLLVVLFFPHTHSVKPRYELLFKELVKCASDLHPDSASLRKALADIQSMCKVVNEKKRESDEKQRRGFLEQHASMEVLRAHELEVRSITTVKFCGKCEKSVFSIGRKSFKCTACGQYFHNECAEELGDGKYCPQRRRLDLSAKELIDQFEVYLMPDEESSLKPQQSKSGSKLLLPNAAGGGGKGSSNASPSMRRLSQSPAVARKSQTSMAVASVVEIRALLFCFQDGLGIAHKWVFKGDEDNPVIDMIGELPWKTVSMRMVTGAPNMSPFVISSNSRGVASMKFYVKTMLELQALDKKIRTIQEECLAVRELKQSEMRKLSLQDGAGRTLLAASDRYKKANQREGGEMQPEKSFGK